MRKIFLLLSLVYSFNVGFGQVKAGEPTIGQTKKIIHRVCRIDVGWNGKNSINNVYAAPSGWQIVEFKPIVISKRQRTSYSFDLTPSNFGIVTTSVVDTKFAELLEIAGKNGTLKKYEANIKQMRNDYERYYKKIISTHSQITTTGSVRGDNNSISRKPGRLYLDLEIKLVYYPDSEEQFLRSIQVMKDIIEKG